ncbi:MAG: LPS assembly lipoprotein LptE [Candidatus Stygibacter frigidus]|nr:LPS assembly lipoprotein LptE [Candidatus Stygibacter frigidus]
MYKYLMVGMIFLLLIVNSCSYSVYSNSLPHLKTIAVERFENKSDQFNLEEELWNYLNSEYNSDGRLRVVSLSPDCMLEGVIMDYSRKIDTYDESGIEEYNVRLLYRLSFTDMTTGEVIWEKDSLILSEVYSETNDESEYHSEEEAREAIYKKLFNEIMKNTLEQW